MGGGMGGGTGCWVDGWTDGEWVVSREHEASGGETVGRMGEVTGLDVGMEGRSPWRDGQVGVVRLAGSRCSCHTGRGGILISRRALARSLSRETPRCREASANSDKSGGTLGGLLRSLPERARPGLRRQVRLPKHPSLLDPFPTTTPPCPPAPLAAAAGISCIKTEAAGHRVFGNCADK